MSETISDKCPTDPDLPVSHRQFVLRVSLLAMVILGLHAAQFFFIRKDLQAIRRAALPRTRSLYSTSVDDMVLPGNSVVWKDEVWASATIGTGIGYGPMGARGTSARLVAIDKETGEPRETGLVLSPSPVGMVVLDDQLWMVSESSVGWIENNKVVQRNPRRHLNQSSKPFVYEGKIAVVDKNANDIYTLLVYQEGEWTAVGLVDVPAFVGTSPWQQSELRVLPVRDRFLLFFFDAATLHYREGFGDLTDPNNVPVSALQAENDRTSRELEKIGVSRLDPVRKRMIANNSQNSGWKTSGVGISWNQTWDVGVVDQIPTIFSATVGSATIQKFAFRDGVWITLVTSIPVKSACVSYVTGSAGLLLHDSLNLVAVDPWAKSKFAPEALHVADKFDFLVAMLSLCVRYSLLAAVLGIGTSWLMKMSRSPNYLYGKRHAVHASILRRGIARGVDTIITAYPPMFWFAHAMQNESQDPWSYSNNQEVMKVLLLLLSIFAVWIGGILVLSVMQGLWGVTPGKWLCNIRTFRTTLRPCGPLRGVARELLIYVDGLFLAVWLPGVLSIAFSQNWQRLGDLAADTIVVVNPDRQSWIR